jgi:hypothetical protein
VIEVNSSPSLARENIFDELIKQQLVDDIIELVDPILFDRKRLCEVLERRLISFIIKYYNSLIYCRVREETGLKSSLNYGNNSQT